MHSVSFENDDNRKKCKTDLCAKHPNTEDIQGLSPHIFGSHVDDTFHTKASTGCCGSYAMLTCASLSDDARLANASSEEDLPDMVNV